jgi:hypothetical protein
VSEEDLELPPLDITIVKSLILTAVASMTEMTDERADYLDKHVDGWLSEVVRDAKNDAWFEGFSAGWDECADPDGFVNDKWDSKTPSPYRKEDTNG